MDSNPFVGFSYDQILFFIVSAVEEEEGEEGEGEAMFQYVAGPFHSQ